MNTFGTPHHHFRECDSTNLRARELAEAGAPGGLVVTAGSQTAGRGRQGRSWVAPPGGALLYSALLRPLTLANELLPLAVPLAICDAVEELAPQHGCQVKWPNDVWIDGRKVAGVLIEARADSGGGFAVIGVGLNVAISAEQFPPDLRETATSVGAGTSVAAARDSVSSALGNWVGRSADEVTAEFGRRDALAGRQISWAAAADGSRDLSGEAAGITARGELRVIDPEGAEHALSAGEVHIGH